MNKLMSAAVISMAAGLAMAQGECCEKTEASAHGGSGGVHVEKVVTVPLHIDSGSFGVIGVTDEQPETKTTTHITMVQKEDDHEYKVEIKNDDINAWVDGKRVPQDRIKVADNTIAILDKSGDKLTEFQYQKGGGFGVGPDRRIVTRSLNLGRDNDGPIVWDVDSQIREPFEGFAVQPEISHPPVMLGITMNKVNEDDADDRLLDILDEHDLSAEDVILVSSVIDDLPADEAGIRDGDVIIGIDGEWGVNSDTLREVLSDKEPGDEIEVVVVRRGKLREMEIELAAWDAEKLGIITYQGMSDFDQQWEQDFVWPEQGEQHEEMLKQLRKQLGDLGQNNEELDIQLRALAQELSKQGLNSRGGSPRIELDVMPRIQRFSPNGGGQDRLLVQPAPRAEAYSGLEERFNRLEDRLARLEDRLDRILDAMERDDD